jgi:putative membrane protein
VASEIPSYGLAPYCGLPPAPDALWSRWNLDPLLVASLGLALAAYVLLAESRRWIREPRPVEQRLCFYAGWAVAAAALVSPLCALSVSLSAARVGQHMLLAAVAAPLIALGLRRQAASRPRPFEAIAAALTFGVVLWFWHAPGPYDATFRSAAVYWAMHLSAFGSALWLWSAVLAAGVRRLGEAIVAAAFTSLQMGLLGAILTFAGRPLYAAHRLTTAAWGLSPLVDQQLAGAIMWIPAGLILTTAVVAGLALTLKAAETRSIAAGQPGMAP